MYSDIIGFAMTKERLKAMEKGRQRNDLRVKTFMEVAKTIANLSTCQFLKVGCIVVSKDWKIISTGYNGTVAGKAHCEDCEMTRDEHKEFADKYEVHAELNSILQAIDKNCSLVGASVFCNISPCFNCMKHIRAAGIRQVYFETVYWRTTLEELMKNAKELDISLTQV